MVGEDNELGGIVEGYELDGNSIEAHLVETVAELSTEEGEKDDPAFIIEDVRMDAHS